MHQLPESGRAEVEHPACEIDRRMNVEQPPPHRSEYGFSDRQFAGRRRAMEEQQFHA
jgi:hypothetical protein